MINADVIEGLSSHERHAYERTITDPAFISVIGAHIKFYNKQLTLLDPNSDDLKHQYTILRTYRDNWLRLQEESVKLLETRPDLRGPRQ